MGLITSTGFFQYIPPDPSIRSVSAPTGYIGEIISVYGTDLDYVDNFYFGNQNLNFSLAGNLNQQIDFIVPSNPDTGVIEITVNNFPLTGNNKLPFLPIYEIDFYDPQSGPEGTEISVFGRVLTSINEISIYANPIVDDIDYYLSGERNAFKIPTTLKSGNSFVSLSQNINKNAEVNNFHIGSVGSFTTISGRALELKCSTNNLQQKYYENHIYNFKDIIDSGSGIFTATGKIPSGSSSQAFTLPTGLFNSNYVVFYNLLYTGNNFNYFSYISGKTSSNFNIVLNSGALEDIKINYLLINSGLNPTGLEYDSGIYNVGFKNMALNVSNETVYYTNNKRYTPFLLTSSELISGQAIGNSFSGVNIYNLNSTGFQVNIPNSSASNTFRLNYLLIDNAQTNLSTFVYDGAQTAYKKVYLMSGDANTFLEKILVNFTAVDKNKINFNIPDTEYHVNGNIYLKNTTGIIQSFDQKFVETPLPTGVIPTIGKKNQNIIILGKSFKKPILLDSTGEYNSCLVRFRYAENSKKKNLNFETDFEIINKNLLSGKIPSNNFPTGIYAIQLASEQGGLFE